MRTVEVYEGENFDFKGTLRATDDKLEFDIKDHCCPGKIQAIGLNCLT
jgi:hypothetical protein